MNTTTKTAQFTPGPWVVNTFIVNGHHKLEVLDATGANACVQANAHLIAAAPAMYEALAKLRLEAIHYRNTGVGKQFLNEAIAQAEQAINQVWGEGNHDTKREG